MKSLYRLFLSALFFLMLAGCESVQFHVPGEKKVVIENIFSEYYSIAEEYFGMKNYSKSAEFYIKSASSDALHNAALYNAARAYALAKNWEKALEIYTEIEKSDGENLEIQRSIAYIYAMSGDFEKAENLYSLLIAENPDIAELLVNYTIVLLSQEKYEEAKANLELLNGKFPDEEKIKSIAEEISVWEASQIPDDSNKIPDELKTEARE